MATVSSSEPPWLHPWHVIIARRNPCDGSKCVHSQNNAPFCRNNLGMFAINLPLLHLSPEEYFWPMSIVSRYLYVSLLHIRMYIHCTMLPFFPVCRYVAQSSVVDTLTAPTACIELWMVCSRRQGRRAVSPSVMLSMPLLWLTPFRDQVIPVWMGPILALLPQ